ncbi:hypothetical protein C1645_834339 [Glomus cerebriforme]|uniref:Uncharacterized protein n=1 Tax=Glomus cerebriforme TaxID=658196 RepID=A0A397SC69_9GLOM|nr:hypothetical protein C1645_834339 [Glomus cerebriforme]
MSDTNFTITRSSFSAASANKRKKHRYNLEGANASTLFSDNADNADYDSEQIRNQACEQRQEQRYDYSHSRGYNYNHDHDHTLRNSNVKINEDTNQIKYIPPVDIKDFLKKVHAAIYLSLDRLWDVPTEALLKDLYTQLKQDLAFPEEIRMPNIVKEDDIFANIWFNDQQIAQMDESDKIKHYLQIPDELKTLDPLL